MCEGVDTCVFVTLSSIAFPDAWCIDDAAVGGRIARLLSNDQQILGVDLLTNGDGDLLNTTGLLGAN